MLNSETVKKVAKLARLQVTEEEAKAFEQQLEKVLTHFEKISKVDTTGIEPLVTPSPVEFFMREDVVVQNTSVEEILENAPQTRGNLFQVPPVVG